MQIIEALWWVTLAILTGYHLLIFRIRRRTTVPAVDKASPGVSIIIAVRNDSDRLLRNLQIMLQQEYPLYEIIVVDDHSHPKEKDTLDRTIEQLEKVCIHHSDRTPGKKHALTLGIEKANHELILCTDADCAPASPLWMSMMTQSMKGSRMVLGYSPYTREEGLLNVFIRFETLMTGIQYLSWAMVGKPYMGVGRNLMYERDLFLQINPYERDQLPYGDDDLWVQQAASVAQVDVCLDSLSHVYSESEKSWTTWWQQKHRHLSAGHHYTAGAWLKPGIYGLALSLHWLTVLLLCINAQLTMILVAAFIPGLLLRWFTYSRWSRQLGDRDTVYYYPWAEPVYAFYLSALGLKSMMVKKKTWSES